MHFGVSVPNNQGVYQMSTLVDFAVEAERLGFESGWVSDHLFHAAYVAQRLDERPYHEPLTLLSIIAARTERFGLGTSVLVLPWHHPVRLAKTIASLDNFSDGRVQLGVGVGVTKDEYAALGIEFTSRGRLANEQLAVMKALWTQSEPTHSGAHYAFSGLRFEPKPSQNPHPPIWIGGNSEAAHRRLVAFGDAWHPLGVSPNDLRGAHDALKTKLRDASRATDVPIAVRLIVEFKDQPSERPIAERKTCRGTPEEMVALIAAYRDAGATHVIFDGATHDVERTHRDFERLQAEVLPHIAR
ncbi:MAG: LLM class F420-dependent oxidoreductase [Pseudomonadota bacterium]